jgi:1-acyl-sn-glycerol-3-phosphate acyltransferase
MSMATVAEPIVVDPPPVRDRIGWLVRGFTKRYAVPYVRKHFHAVRLSKTSAPFPADDAPRVVVLNHPSWWDPMVCIALSREFGPTWEHYPAIDAEALAKYAFFRRLGFFGVDTHSLRGAAEFLRTAAALLAKPNRAVWVTAQGQFSDVRSRPLNLRSGVGHLAARMERGFILPLAVEYTFWTERTPEALLRFGTSIDVTEAPGRSGRDWTARIEEALTDALDGLSAEAMSRDPERFTTLVGGKAGVGGVYDLWRRLKAAATGRRFVAEHGGRP